MENIAYCGLYCGDCPSRTGVIADRARDLRKELRRYRFDKTAEVLSSVPFFREYEKYDDCYQVLGAMVKLRCGKTCRNGGANPGCKIRKCAQKKELDGCWECRDFEGCEKLEFLNTNHGRAHILNLKELAKQGTEAFEAGEKHWYKK